MQVSTQGRRRQQATLKTRQSVTQLSEEQLDRFRRALTQFLDRRDNQGFHFYAGWHGVPFDLCEHHNEWFLPWHRGYLYHFELGLQSIDADVTLPWWNWMDESGIPEAYVQAEDGEENVLASAPIDPFGVPSQGGWPEATFREPGAVPEPAAVGPPLQTVTNGDGTLDVYEWVMEPPTYTEFRNRCERLHDNIHVWVGGTMRDPNWAAYDPLFWAHHTMVDRLWRIWQHRHPGAAPPRELFDEPMNFGKPPALKVGDVLDVKQLGYEYSAQAASVEGPG